MKRQIRQTLFSLILFSIIVILYLFISQSAIAQMQFEWVRNYPITGRAAAIDSSGYVYFVGEQTDGTHKILKYDSLGNIIWAQDFNVITGSNYLGIAAYKSRYFYITYSTQGHSFGLSKFDTSGTLLWTRNISGYYYEPYCMTLDTSGYIYVAGEIGYYASNSFTVKYSPAGDTLWRAIYYPSTNGGSYTGLSISVDNQKNVYITGGINHPDYTYSYGTIKYDSLGNRKWVSKYYSPYSSTSFTRGYCVKADNKGNCYVTGVTLHSLINGVYRYAPVTIKYGSDGDSIWTRLFVLADTIDFGGGSDIAIDDNENIFIPCYYTIKYDKNGNLLWYKNNNFPVSREILFENNIYVSGGFWEDRLQMLGYDNERGNLIFNQIYPTPHPVISGGNLTFSNNLYLYAYANDSAILIKYTTNTSSISENANRVNNFKLSQNYPNPFNSSTVIKYSLNVNCLITLKIYDISGKEIGTLINERKPQGNYTVNFDGSDLSSGIYFYSLFADDILIDTKKLIIIK
ncbi:MAG: T9SS type A sorting domain-containing protein [Ignavibacteria bacterium]